MTTQASNTTANYGLSQWAESDRILMADFNADNAAIDAALKANAEGLTAALAGQLLVKLDVPILTTETDANGDACVTADLSGLDMSQYRAILLGASANSNVHASAYLRLNHDSGANYASSSSSGESGIYMRTGVNMVCLVNLNGVKCFTLPSVNEVRYNSYSGGAWNGITRLSLTNNGTLLWFYGVKA